MERRIWENAISGDVAMSRSCARAWGSGALHHQIGSARALMTAESERLKAGGWLGAVAAGKEECCDGRRQETGKRRQRERVSTSMGFGEHSSQGSRRVGGISLMVGPKAQSGKGSELLLVFQATTSQRVAWRLSLSRSERRRAASSAPMTCRPACLSRAQRCATAV